MKPLLRGVLLAALLVSAEAARAEWVVQIAAFADSTFLRQMAESIRKAGFPVTTEPLAQENGPALTRLLAGPYETKAEAEAAAVQLAAHGWPGYVKQRTEARKPTLRLAPPPQARTPAVPPPAARAPSTSKSSVPPVPVRSEPTPSAPLAPSSRVTPSLQPARPAEPPAPSSASRG